MTSTAEGFEIDKLYQASVDDKNKGASFLGDWTQYAITDIDFFGPELALLFILQVFFFVNLLGRLNGRFLRMG